MPHARRLSGSRKYLLVGLVALAGSVTAQQSPEERDAAMRRQALQDLAQFADQICKPMSDESSSSTIELSADLKAKLDGVIKKVADLGFTGAAKYSDSKSKGVLQRDLAAALQKKDECRVEVVKLMRDSLISPMKPVSLEESYRQGQQRAKDVAFLRRETEEFGRDDFGTGAERIVERKARITVPGDQLMITVHESGVKRSTGEWWEATEECSAPLRSLSPPDQLFSGAIFLYCNGGACWHCRTVMDRDLDGQRRVVQDVYSGRASAAFSPGIDLPAVHRAIARLISNIGSDIAVQECCGSKVETSR